MKHFYFTCFIFLELAIISFLLVSGSRAVSSEASGIIDKKNLVKNLSLTDFAIWTEAAYTRHPSQSDFFTPFQDFPSSIEHFPAGSIIPPGAIGIDTSMEFKKKTSKNSRIIE